MSTKLHAVTDASGRPLSVFMTAGQISDYVPITMINKIELKLHRARLQWRREERSV